MGYTHYYQIVDEAEWARIWPLLFQDIPVAVEGANVLVDFAVEGSVGTLDCMIVLNGFNHDSHEPFCLGQHGGEYFCKTARKPYDLAVCTILLRAKRLAGDAFKVNSDGCWNDELWRRADDLYEKLWEAQDRRCPWPVDSERDVKPQQQPFRIATRSVPAIRTADARCVIQRKSQATKFASIAKVVNSALLRCVSDSAHSLCKESRLQWRPLPGVRMRLIDVHQGCIVNAPDDCAFVALSYVWGKTSFPVLNNESMTWLTEPGSIWQTGNIPTVMADAILLCDAMGERYLWVDALCINQDDGRDKAIQILRMHNIFGGAKFTMVAAAGVDANSYLYPDCRDDISAVSSPNIFGDSVWDRRGWTFQEGVLSHRLLVFSHKGLFLECRSCSWQISPASGVQLWCSSPPACSILTAPGLTQLQKFYSLVTTYSERCFTDESDALDAFQGILKQFSTTLDDQDNEFRFGLPTAAFDQSLCWQTNQHLPYARRTEFPSWSWLGWKQRVYWNVNTDIAVRSAQSLFQPRGEGYFRLVGRELALSNFAQDGFRQYENRRCCANPDEGSGNLIWGLPVTAIMIQLHDKILHLYCCVMLLQVSEIGEMIAKTSNATYTARSMYGNQDTLCNIQLDQDWRNSQPEGMVFIAIDGHLFHDELIVTKLMCLAPTKGLLPTGSCATSGELMMEDFVRVQVVDCEVKEDGWREAGGQVTCIHIA